MRAQVTVRPSDEALDDLLWALTSMCEGLKAQRASIERFELRQVALGDAAAAEARAAAETKDRPPPE